MKKSGKFKVARFLVASQTRLKSPYTGILEPSLTHQQHKDLTEGIQSSLLLLVSPRHTGRVATPFQASCLVYASLLRRAEWHRLHVFVGDERSEIQARSKLAFHLSTFAVRA